MRYSDYMAAWRDSYWWPDEIWPRNFLSHGRDRLKHLRGRHSQSCDGRKVPVMNYTCNMRFYTSAKGV